MLESKFLFPLNDEVCVDDVAPADYDDDRPRVGDDGLQEAGQQPAVDGPTGGLHQHAVMVRELETGGQSDLGLHLLQECNYLTVLVKPVYMRSQLTLLRMSLRGISRSLSLLGQDPRLRH